MDYALVRKESVRFWTKLTTFLKYWSEIWEEMQKLPEVSVAG